MIDLVSSLHLNVAKKTDIDGGLPFCIH